MTLLQTAPKKQSLAQLRQQRSLVRGVQLRTNANVLSPASFQARKGYMVPAYQEGKFLAEPENRGKPRPNPMSDPAAMEGMMGMMKGNMAMMVPQTLIMGWINAFFSGFVISAYSTDFSLCWHALYLHLLTRWSETAVSIDASVQVNASVGCRNARLGREVGVQSVVVLSDPVRFATRVQLHPWKQQLYVRPSLWSLYHLSLFYLSFHRLTSLFSSAANQVTQQMAMANPGAGMMGPEQDPDKLFQNEAENLEVLQHRWILEGIEDRLIAKLSS